MSITNEAVKLAFNKGYRISINGDVLYKGRVVNKDYNKSGRARFRMKDIRKKPVNVPVHKLQAYQKFGESMFALGIQVRHLDGNHLNNEPNNIAIGTPHDNMMDIPKEERIRKAIHASSFISKNVIAGDIEFPSYCAAARHFGISDNGIRRRISLGWVGYEEL